VNAITIKLQLTVEVIMKKAMIVALMVFYGIILAVNAAAGTRDDCVTKCKEAAELIQTKGIDAGIKEIGNKNGPFVWNDGVSYVFVMDMNANMLAHPIMPKLTKAKNLIETKDVNGKKFNVDMIEAAKKGKGWTKYIWPVPGMDVNKPKYTFIYRVQDTDYFVAAGYYVIKAGVYR
jgi:hypothetical protein